MQRFSSFLKSYGLYLAVSVLILLGGILRFYDLGSAPYWMDEGYTINAVLSIEEKGESILDSGFPYSCPLYCYPTAWIAEKIGDTPVSYRLLSAGIGTFFIGAMFFLIRTLTSVRVALLTTFLLAFSYWQIAWSRQARWYTLFALFFWLSLFFFYRTLRTPHSKPLYALATAVCTALAIQTHSIGFVLPFIFMGWVAIEQLFFKRSIHFRGILIALIPILGALLTVILVKPEFLWSLFSRIEFHYVLPYYMSFLLRSYWLFLPFMLIALFMSHAPHRSVSSYLLLVFVAYLIPLSFLTNIVHYRYLFQVTPVFFILAGIGFFALYDKLQERILKYAFVLLFSVTFLSVGGGVILPQATYPLESDDPSMLAPRPFYSYTPQPDWNSAYGYIQAERNPEDMIISSHPHFTKIFLQEAGYWIKYNYLGFEETASKIVDDREYYVGAKVIDDLAELKALTEGRDGFIIFDYMAVDGKIDPLITAYIETTFELVFHAKENSFSEIWVYRF